VRMRNPVESGEAIVSRPTAISLFLPVQIVDVQ